MAYTSMRSHVQWHIEFFLKQRKAAAAVQFRVVLLVIGLL